MSNYNIKNKCQVKNLNNIYIDTFGYKNNGHYVEVGAFDGFSWSNTSGLAEAGWTGLLFEPVPKFFKKCVNNYKKYNKVTIVNCCIGNIDDKYTKVYLGGSITTTSKEMVDIYNSLKWAKKCGLNKNNFINSKMYTLNFMFEKYNWPNKFDVLVVDTEGTELDVLNGFDIKKWKPQLAIIESCEKHNDKCLTSKAPQINKYFEQEGYKKIYCDRINSIYRI